MTTEITSLILISVFVDVDVTVDEDIISITAEYKQTVPTGAMDGLHSRGI
jgi:hypothetical protein